MTLPNDLNPSSLVWDPPPNPDAIAINAGPLESVRARGYSFDDCFGVCKEIDETCMAALVSFSGDGESSFRVTKRTWSRQEGHYPSMVTVLKELAKHPMLKRCKGEVIIWLEDGMWASHRELSRRAPIFSFGREVSDEHTFLIPDPAYLDSGGYADELACFSEVSRQHPWESRHQTAYWRGAATGLGIESDAWRRTARGRLVLLSQSLGKKSELDAKLTRLHHLPGATIEDMINAGVVSDEVPFDTFFSYRYMLDADGYSCAWKSFFFKLAIGSVVLKVSSPFEQWYHRRLRPWQHFIPLQSDLSDFGEAYQWLLAHDSKARTIASAGEQFVRSLSLVNSLDEMAYYLVETLRCQHPSSTS